MTDKDDIMSIPSDDELFSDFNVDEEEIKKQALAAINKENEDVGNDEQTSGREVSEKPEPKEKKVKTTKTDGKAKKGKKASPKKAKPKVEEEKTDEREPQPKRQEVPVGPTEIADVLSVNCIAIKKIIELLEIATTNKGDFMMDMKLLQVYCLTGKSHAKNLEEAFGMLESLAAQVEAKGHS
jgi:hypothetical protein